MKGRGNKLLAAVAVFLITCVVFLPSLSNEFVNWDDQSQLVENFRYRGLGVREIKWMFTTMYPGHYHPLTWLSFGMDYIVWGMNPFGYHLTNLILHALNAVLFYFLCFTLLSRAPPAALAALLFSLHPLRVESVAWAVERRDVLSSFFFLATMLTWLKGRLRTSYLLFACSLLSKAGGVGLPLVLLVLDVFALGRLPQNFRLWGAEKYRRLLLEKIPFFLMSILKNWGIFTLSAVPLKHFPSTSHSMTSIGAHKSGTDPSNVAAAS